MGNSQCFGGCNGGNEIWFLILIIILFCCCSGGGIGGFGKC